MSVRQRLFHACAMGAPGAFSGKALPWSIWRDEEWPRALPQSILITVDVEPGYLDESGERHWFRQNPEAWAGTDVGMRLLLDVLEKHHVPATFFCCPHNHLMPDGIPWWHRIQDGRHEVGLHLHPADDRVLADKAGFALPANRASYYTHDQRKSLISLAKGLLESESGLSVNALRWGNWSMDSEAAEDVLHAGISIDASSCPGLAGHMGDDRAYDWRSTASVPHFLGATELLEMPITTLSLYGRPLMRLDPAWGRIFLNQWPRISGHPLLHLITHSSEMCDKQGRPSRVLECLDLWIGRARQMQIQFDTCTHAAASWKRTNE